MIFKRKPSKENKILKALQGRSIVLVGIMGCGKSAIGKLAAKKLGLKFVDADIEIEKAAGRSVADIFEEYGEEEFRRLEAKVIDRLLDGKSCVLALGGGAFMNDTTRENILQKAVSIWIKADLDVLTARVLRKPGKRPLLATGDPRKKLNRTCWLSADRSTQRQICRSTRAMLAKQKRATCCLMRCINTLKKLRQRNHDANFFYGTSRAWRPFL